MGFLEWVVIVVFICHFMLDFFMVVYTRLAKKVDDYLLSKESVTINCNHNSTNLSSIMDSNHPKWRKMLSKLYYILNPFAYGLMRYRIICVGKLPSCNLRNWIYRYIYNMQITKKTVIYGGCEIRSPWNIHADRCVIQAYCILDGRAGIYFDQDVVLGSGVHIWTEEHNIDDPYFSVLPENRAPVYIGSHAWICSDTTILPGVTVGEGSVLASKACLTYNAEAYGVYGGIPARKIKERSRDLRYELTGKPTWYFF